MLLLYQSQLQPCSPPPTFWIKIIKTPNHSTATLSRAPSLEKTSLPWTLPKNHLMWAQILEIPSNSFFQRHCTVHHSVWFPLLLWVNESNFVWLQVCCWQSSSAGHWQKWRLPRVIWDLLPWSRIHDWEIVLMSETSCISSCLSHLPVPDDFDLECWSSSAQRIWKNVLS